MKNSKAFEMFEKTARMGEVSEDLRYLHNEFIYSLDLDSVVFEKKHQTALYALNEIIEAFKILESELFGSKNEEVNNLKRQISELEKSNQNLTLNLDDNRKLIAKLENQVKGNG